MKVLYLLFSLLFIFLMPLPGVFGDIRNPFTCVRSGAICHPGFCPRRYKHIGVCGVSAIKCCKKP
ncbi:PREDICTED: beta-defensin 4A-like [Cercocebus atys]|uniref:Beta/alpha-defensin C-terminal domain-containing protein n=1 Tax=Cercocebus atys TaxID=9531 RepID=A0A2K5LR40_CERAT|nr:PREDICTED: beta-defensin 4A-like [Cercocebus atys]